MKNKISMLVLSVAILMPVTTLAGIKNDYYQDDKRSIPPKQTSKIETDTKTLLKRLANLVKKEEEEQELKTNLELSLDGIHVSDRSIEEIPVCGYPGLIKLSEVKLFIIQKEMEEVLSLLVTQFLNETAYINEGLKKTIFNSGID